MPWVWQKTKKPEATEDGMALPWMGEHHSSEARKASLPPRGLEAGAGSSQGEQHRPDTPALPGENCPTCAWQTGWGCPRCPCEFAFGRQAKKPIGKAVKIVTILTIINSFLCQQEPEIS